MISTRIGLIEVESTVVLGRAENPVYFTGFIKNGAGTLAIYVEL